MTKIWFSFTSAYVSHPLKPDPTFIIQLTFQILSILIQLTFQAFRTHTAHVSVTSWSGGATALDMMRPRSPSVHSDDYLDADQQMRDRKKAKRKHPNSPPPGAHKVNPFQVWKIFTKLIFFVIECSKLWMNIW